MLESSEKPLSALVGDYASVGDKPEVAASKLGWFAGMRKISWFPANDYAPAPAVG